ncbi:MAG: ankyrin repeat domain-containing protein [Alphaproteobacteria bacterium]
MAIFTVVASFSARAEIDLLKNDRLIEAAKADDLKAAESLLNRKHNVDVREQNGRTPLFISAARGAEDFVELLIKHDAKIDDVDKFGNSPIYYAAAGNHVGVVEILLEGGANVNLQNRLGLTPLMIAASEGHLATVQALIDAKADAAVTDFTGRTAWEWAQRSNRRHVLRFLKSAGIER